MRVAYIGNFKPEHSTENDIADTLERMGHEGVLLQEDDYNAWFNLTRMVDEYDAVMWTSTRSLAEQIPETAQLQMLWHARRAGVPTIGFHLDRWWGLSRWVAVLQAPFFRCQFVFTADGAHQGEFQAAGVNHHWSPPAIAPRNVGEGTPRREFEVPIAFVGSWQGGYHQEWQHRAELVEFLRNRYGRRVGFWPQRGQPAVRGEDLKDLYASVTVVVGDSCLVPTVRGSRMKNYCSDRVFETIGRGGFLLHPEVPGITDSGLLSGNRHMATWKLYEWTELKSKIDHYLDHPDEAVVKARQGMEHVKLHHTYYNRLQWIFKVVGL